MSASDRGHRLALLAVWLASAAYLLLFVDRGWIPDDEGLLGHSAERVLAGELPHRDFSDLYTGGLAFWHALVFRLLGVEIVSLRWALYFATLVFVPIYYRLASRFAGPLLASAVTATAVVWSIPNYFSGMPTWYNLFWTTGGTLALVRHVEDGRRRWLVVGGACAGASFLVKSVGLFFVAAGLLFLVFREGEVETAESDDRRPPVLPGRLYSAAITLGLLAFVAALVTLVSGRPGPMELLHFVAPGLALVALLVVAEWRRPSGEPVRRLRRLLGLGVPFVLGVLLPIGLFLLPYLVQGGLFDYLRGHFLFPSQRLRFGVWSLPIPATLICAVPVVALLLGPFGRTGSRQRLRYFTAALAMVAAIVLAHGADAKVYQTVWLSLRPLVPAVALAGAWLLGRRKGSTAERQILFLMLATASLFSVVQFPYSRSLHFLYGAPLLLLAWVALRRWVPFGHRPAHATVLAFYALFALVWLNPGWIEAMERRFVHFTHDRELGLGRGDGLWVTAEAASLYGALVGLVRQHSAEGEPIYAGPDCAEIYFLSGRPNPTPAILDYLDPDFGTPARGERLLSLLAERRIRVVVLRRQALFTPLDLRFAAEVERRYPRRIDLPPYSVHWRDDAPAPRPATHP